jgi:nucleotide-binding universal stress UspA family protein
MKKIIIVPLDGSETAESVLPFACRLAKEEESQLVLLHIVEYPLDLYHGCWDYPPLDPGLLDEIQARKQAILQNHQTYLEQVSHRLSKAGSRVEFEVREGPVVETILETVRQLSADLIVIATHGYSGKIHGLVGAVANRLLSEAETPVILYRPQPGILARGRLQMHQAMVAA